MYCTDYADILAELAGYAPHQCEQHHKAVERNSRPGFKQICSNHLAKKGEFFPQKMKRSFRLKPKHMFVVVYQVAARVNTA